MIQVSTGIKVIGGEGMDLTKINDWITSMGGTKWLAAQVLSLIGYVLMVVEITGCTACFHYGNGCTFKCVFGNNN